MKVDDKPSGSQIYRWPFQIRSISEFPSNFRTTVRAKLGQEMTATQSALFIPPLEDVWITRRRKQSYAIVHDTHPENRIIIFEEERSRKILFHAINNENLDTYHHSVGLLLGHLEFTMTQPNHSINIFYKTVAERYLCPILKSFLCSWMNVDLLGGSKELEQISEEIPQHYRIAATDVLPRDMPLIAHIFQPEQRVTKSLWRHILIPASLWLMTSRFLIVVRSYSSATTDFGYRLSILPSDRIESVAIKNHSKSCIAEIEIHLQRSGMKISAPINVNNIERFAVLQQQR